MINHSNLCELFDIIIQYGTKLFGLSLMCNLASFFLLSF